MRQAALQIETTAATLREVFLSGSMPADMEQLDGEEAVYLLLDEHGALLQAAGTRTLFWEKWAEVGRRMKPDAVLIESPGGAVMVLTKLRRYASSP